MALRQHKLFGPAVGAGLAILAGLALWVTPLGDPWVNASYDYLFRFGARTLTNQLVLIQMDNESFHFYHQTRGRPWDRAIHAELLNRLADDGCKLVVLDVRFAAAGDPAKDQALANALRRQRRALLMAIPGGLALHHARGDTPDAEAARALLPNEMFLNASGTNWGVAWLDPDRDNIVRRHWPFPDPGPPGLPSLPWVAAELAGAKLSSSPQERWLRYYARQGVWDSLSYRLALTQKQGYFKDKIVFVGHKPQSSAPIFAEEDLDKFSTPYTRWTGEAVGGVEVLATAFLNLVNGDWLRRLGWAGEVTLLILSGVLIGGTLGQVRPRPACALGVGIAFCVMLMAVWFSQVTNLWFPWLLVSAAQIPCALAWAVARPKPSYAASSYSSDASTIVGAPVSPITSGSEPGSSVTLAEMPLPDSPDYEIVDPPFGKGAFGKVWLARNAIGQWQALKAVYLAPFGARAKLYDREFSGIRRYKPISDNHPGLLRVDFVSKKKREGYFYYVMELGDAVTPGWETDPSKYVPLDLARMRSLSEGRRLPISECLRIGIILAEALDYLHQQSVTHGDIKPQNIIFVNGYPKLADVGLVDDAQPSGTPHTWVGTPGYMPPSPEAPGSLQSDIYGLGMVLYVISSGSDPHYFPEVSFKPPEPTEAAAFGQMKAVILKACHPDRDHRFASAKDIAESLRLVQSLIEPPSRTRALGPVLES